MWIHRCGVTGDGSFQKKKKKRWLNRAEMQRLAEEKEAAAAYPYIPRTMLSLALSEWSNVSRVSITILRGGALHRASYVRFALSNLC